MFPTYQFKHPLSDYVERLGGWSYVWAALFGPFYLAYKGFWGLFFLYTLIILPLIALAVMFALGLWSCLFGYCDGVISATNYDYWQMVRAAVWAGYVFLVSQLVVRSARRGYLRRGWQILR